MNFYFVEKVYREDRISILNALRHVMQSMYRGFSVKPVLHNASADHDQLFLEVPDGLLWCRVLFEPFSLSLFKSLCDEWKDWIQITGERVMLYIFFPCVTDGTFDFRMMSNQEKQELLNQDGIRFFEYFFMMPDGSEGIALWEAYFVRRRKRYRKNLPFTAFTQTAAQTIC